MSTNTKKKPAKKAVKKARPIDKAERNQRYQVSPEYKAHRKNRYLTEPEYREKCLANSKAQAERRIKPLAEAYEREVKSMIRKRRSIGQLREVKDIKQLTFTPIELAELICRPAAAVRLWINNGRFPQPSHKITKVTGVYTEEQALAICDVMIKHLRTKSAHLTVNRKEAILALHSAMR